MFSNQKHHQTLPIYILSTFAGMGPQTQPRYRGSESIARRFISLKVCFLVSSWFLSGTALEASAPCHAHVLCWCWLALKTSGRVHWALDVHCSNRTSNETWEGWETNSIEILEMNISHETLNILVDFHCGWPPILDFWDPSKIPSIGSIGIY